MSTPTATTSPSPLRVSGSLREPPLSSSRPTAPPDSALPLPRREWIACCRPAGRRGYPAQLVAAMHADYVTLGSLRHAATLWGITNQAFHDIMRRRGLQRRKKRLPAITYHGERFAPDHQGYYRSTTYACRSRGGHRLLHRVVWEHTHGPIPADHIIAFADGDRANCDISNLRCVPRSQAHTLRRSFANGYTAYHAKAAPLREAYFRTLRDSTDHAAIESARLAYESIPRPSNGSPQTRSRIAKSAWDRLTPEARAARIQKSAAARRRSMQTRGPEIRAAISAGRRLAKQLPTPASFQ